MTDETVTSDAQDERSQSEALEALDMASLRKYAKLMRITAQRDWQKEDYIEAIKTKQEMQNVSVVFNQDNAPAPGHSRIIILRDPTPGHKNSPVPVIVNGRILLIPRGIPVDVPTPYVEVLNNAKGQQYRQTDGPAGNNPMGIFKEEEVFSYPFQVVAATPGGQFTNQNDPRASKARLKAKFHAKFGRFPTDGELNEAIRADIIKNA